MCGRNTFGACRIFHGLMEPHARRLWWRAVGAGVVGCMLLLLLLLVSLKKTKHNATFPAKKFIRSPHSDLSRPDLPRVTCLVVTSPVTDQGRARHLGAAWAPPHPATPCPDTLFLTTATHPDLPKVILSDLPSYDQLWEKVLHGFRSVNVSSSDWFIKADDDTFIVYPHLVQLLSHLDPSRPLMLGFPLVYTTSDGKAVEYMSGGAGYVLSGTAVRLVQGTRATECQPLGISIFEDVNMGSCMAALGVEMVDTRDSLGRARFLPYPPWVLLHEELQQHPDYTWLNTMAKHKLHFGSEYLSDQVISFHQVRNPEDFYLLQYLTFDVRLHRRIETT